MGKMLRKRFLAKCSVCNSTRQSGKGENLGRSIVCIALIFQFLNTLMGIHRNRWSVRDISRSSVYVENEIKRRRMSRERPRAREWLGFKHAWGFPIKVFLACEKCLTDEDPKTIFWHFTTRREKRHGAKWNSLLFRIRILWIRIIFLNRISVK